MTKPRMALETAENYQDTRLRDQFATHAIAALITTHKTVFSHSSFVQWDEYAIEAYKIADAMLRARGT